jgi:hypothetical protein
MVVQSHGEAALSLRAAVTLPLLGDLRGNILRCNRLLLMPAAHGRPCTAGGTMGRAKLGRHTDDLVAGLALGAGEILRMVRVHVLNAKGRMAPAIDDRGQLIGRGSAL